ncbi:MAG: hypothetical protein P8179_10500 [Candidatus Thiodiazotropha sp.]
MKKILASLLLLVTSIGTTYAGELSSTPNILNSIDDNAVAFLSTNERSDTRGEAFFGGSARTRAYQWCRGRGVCWVKVGWLSALAVDPKRDGSVITKSY